MFPLIGGVPVLLSHLSDGLSDRLNGLIEFLGALVGHAVLKGLLSREDGRRLGGVQFGRARSALALETPHDLVVRPKVGLPVQVPDARRQGIPTLAALPLILA